ncbi:MAG: nitroreductase family protein [Candidatus Thorarchaeota archaeon]|jgi:nitroreductase
MNDTSEVFSIIYNRRSGRSFLDKEVSDDVLSEVLKAGMRAPFAAQLCSLVYTRKKEKMKELRIGAYPSTPVLLVFLIDLRRLEKIMALRGHEYGYDDTMSLWLGLQYVSLVVENVTLAAEASGVGSVLLGIAPVRADNISEVFQVPKRVFPVVGMCLGYPDPSEETEIRPRYSLEFSAFEDEYLDHSDLDIRICMKEMDEGYLAQGYYMKKRIKGPLEDDEDNTGFDRYSWSEHISRKFRRGRWKGERLLSILERHGFNLKSEGE